MEKLTIKELAPYLPYRLKIQGQTHKVVHTMCRLGNGGVWTEEQGLSGRTYGAWADIFEIKPLLRPLSQLTEEIEHNGKKFLPAENLFRFYKKDETGLEYDLSEKGIIEIWIASYKNGLIDETLILGDYMKLFEWHFDLFNLLENNLAIEISK